jgi:hypothetical protein
LDNIQWQRALQHVTVEVLALAQAGRDVSAVYTERPVRVEDWKRTADVNVRVENGAVELQLPKDDTLELILKAVPESLAEEIIMAAENAETVPEPVTEEELAEELVLEELAAEELTQEELSQEELALESAEEGLETATETAAEESAEGLTKQHYVDPKDIDAAEKTTMRELRDAIRATTWKKVKTVGRGRTKQVVQLPPADRGFLQTPLADPAIKLAVSVHMPHYTEIHADISTDHQTRTAIDRHAHTRPHDLVCIYRGRPLHSPQIQARAQKALRDQAASEFAPNGAQRCRPPIQANTNPQAQAGWQMEGDRGGADQQRSSCHW